MGILDSTSIIVDRNTLKNIITSILLCIVFVLMKKKVATTRSVRLYIAYINDFAILDAIVDSSDYCYWIQRILLLIPADTVIDSNGCYYY